MGQYSLWKPAAATLPRNDGMIQEWASKFSTRAGSNATSDQSSPIIAERLSPEVIPVFVSNFPLYDLLEKVPSNGLSHTFLQQTAFSQTTAPHTIAETGTVDDDANTYLRKTTNIAQLALRRGVTLKAQYAGANAGGPSANLMERELKGGLLTLARDAQTEFLSYQDTDTSSTTLTAANGKYDANGLNGLRYILNQYAPPENTATVDIRTAWTDQRVLTAVRGITNAIVDKGGKPDLIVCSTRGSQALFADQQQQVRYLMEPSRHEITPGLTVRAISTDHGELPVVIVPGNFLGTWTNGSNTFQDVFILQTETLEIPYLGAPEPTVLRIPIGTDGSLRELAIPFVLLGLAALAPQYLGRVSLTIA